MTKNLPAIDKKFLFEHRHLAYLNLDWNLVRQIEHANLHPLRVKTTRPDLDLLRVIRDPQNFHFTCKYVLNIDIHPMQNVILQELWNRPFPMIIGSRGMGKSFILAVYCILRALICQDAKIAITGAVFRQSKVVFEYIEKIWDSAPVLRSIVGGHSKAGAHHDIDRWWFGIGTSIINAFPVGPDGAKLRGQRANYLIVDEFSVLNPEIYETVISGFAFVAKDPIAKVQELATVKLLKEIEMWSQEQEDQLLEAGGGNQTIISGTAYYMFNHFFRYYERYKKIIFSRGERAALEEIYGGPVDPKFDWRNFSIIRIPIEIVPEGIMDVAQVTRSRATVHSSVYQMEFGAVFSGDSNGFFKRTMIETCVCKTPIPKASGSVFFKATVEGHQNCQYVYGIDPAAEQDNFAIVVLELHPDHSRIVYCWTTDKEDHRRRLKSKAVHESQFYAYVARKIRSLMQVFPCKHIAMDAMGGGGAVMEALRDTTYLGPGEQPILLITADHPLSDKKERDSDDEPGLHIVEMVIFRKNEWTAAANHNMKKDFEDKNLLFPYFDPAEVEFAFQEDTKTNRKYDTLEDCVMNIEELKDELANIVVTATPTGLEHWDTPEVKMSGMKKGRARKDRYSALLMANAAARVMGRYQPSVRQAAVGGFAGQVKKYEGGKLYTGPQWVTQGIGATTYGTSVVRQS